MARVPVSLVAADRVALNQVANLTEEFVLSVTPDFAELSQDEAGGVMRTISTATIIAYGDVATQASRISYESMAVATVGEGFTPVTVDVVARVPELVDPVVGRGMSAYSTGRFSEVNAFLATVLSTVVANIYRETMFTNSDLDTRSSGWQRVTDGDPCAFCAYAAANYDSGLGTFDGDKSFHAKCGCDVIPVFDNDPYVTEDLERYRADAAKAREIILERHSVDRANNRTLRSKDYYKMFPKNAVNTKNLAAEMRRLGQYKDFVPTPYV